MTLYKALKAEHATLALIAVTALAISTRYGMLAFAKTVAGVFAAFCLFALLMPTIHISRDASPRSQCINNLKNIVLALQNYEASHGTFPPAFIADANGTPIHSWRVLILPQLDRADLYRRYRFDEPWDGPNNRLLHNEVIELFQCPSDVGTPNSTQTSYLAVLGSRTAWPGEKGKSVAEIAAQDGSDRTILIVETHRSGIHWMEPRDLQLDWCLSGIDGPLAGSRAGTRGNHPGGGVVGFVDGHVTFLDQYTPVATLDALFNIDDGSPAEAPK